MDALIPNIIVGVIVLWIVVGWVRAWLRRQSEIIDVREGELVGVIVTVTNRARRKGDHLPDSSRVILRPHDGGSEMSVGAGRLWQLPRPVKKQIFRPWWLITYYEPNFALPRTERREAVRRAKHGGYRFDLPDPIPVRITRRTNAVTFDLLR